MNLIANAPNGVYNLTISGTTVPTYCYAYGGMFWALVLKGDGSKQSFAYQSSLWTTTSGLNPSNYAGGLDNNEYLSSLYWQMPFNQMLFGMRNPASSSNIQFGSTGVLSSYSSLYSVISSNSNLNIGLMAKSTWESLFAGAASLEPNCNFVSAIVVYSSRVLT